MTQDEMQKKIEELMANTEFTDKLAQCETWDEIAALFGTEGIEVSGEELERAMAQVSALNENGEINEDDLEQVSGGWSSRVLADFAAYMLGLKLGNWLAKKLKKSSVRDHIRDLMALGR